MNMSIIAASRLRGVFEANTFIGNVYNSVLTNQGNNSVQLRNESDVANFLNSTQYPVAATDIKNLKNNGRDISFFIDVNYIVSQSFQVIDYYIDLDSNCLNFDLDNTQINTKLYYTPISSLANGAYDQNFLSSRSFNYRLGVHFGDKIGNTVGDDNVFRLNQGNGEFWFDLAQSTINNGSPDGDINIAISEGNTVNYASLTQRQDKPTAATISANTIGGTYVELNVSQPTHVNTLKYALVFVDGFFQDVYDINSVYALNLQQQTSYDIKVIIADEYFNISPYSNTLNVTTTTTPALFQNAVAYYKLDETNGDAIDVVNGYNGTLFGGVTQGVAGKIGTAYSFDGSTGYIDYGNNPASQFSDGNGNDIPFTIRMWINPNTIGNQWLFSKDGNSDRELIYRINSGGVIDVFFISGATSIPFINTNFEAGIVTNTWQHLVLTYDGSKSSDGIKLYVNNTEINQSTGVQTFGGFVNGVNQLIFGYQQRSPGTYYDGEVDEQAIIKGEVWDSGKISDDYNNGNGTTI